MKVILDAFAHQVLECKRTTVGVQFITPQNCAFFAPIVRNRQNMYFDRTLQEYLDDLAAAKSTPGGGSASAISGAMGAALASMVARFTLGKAEYADVQAEIEEIVQQTEKLRSRFQELVQADIDAYGRLSAAYKLPRTTEEEREDRSKAIQTQLVEAALVPLEMAEVAAQLMQYCRRIAEIGNVNVLSDVATGGMLASSAGAGAAWIVRTNLRSMKDLELVNVLSDRLHRALDEITLCSQQITSIVGSRA
jgi:methenyltetrahydrofolate cyclohydrolase